MSRTFQNSALVLSIGIFFSLMIVGPGRAPAGGAAPRPGGAGRAGGAADRLRTCRRSATLFAAFLGYNPVQHLLGPARWRTSARAGRGADRPLVLPAR